MRFSMILMISLFSASQAFAAAHTLFEEEAAAFDVGSSNSSDDSGSWNRANNPSHWSPHYVSVLNQLPTEGQMTDHTPWSDTYWPSNQAGIAARWNWPGNDGFKYGTYSESQIRAMSQEQLARLSPAEKYDIYMGRFDYPTVQSIRKKTSPHAEYWAGICNGWSPAAINHAEPLPVAISSASGITVPFGSDDVKALMDAYYADNAQATQFLGARCHAGDTDGNIFRKLVDPFLRTSACDGVNAGALHLILTNELGLKHQGFVADVNRWREIWNQPVFGFTSVIHGFRSPSPDAAPGTVKEAIVHTEMHYADEITPNWNPVVGTADSKTDSGKYDYTLELDANGRIIGGQWISKDRPAFIWAAPKLQFTGYFSGLNAIYRGSAR